MVDADRPASASASPDDAAAFTELSEALREAFATVTASGLAPQQQGRWQQRLLAITNTAKRDTARALGQLHRLLADWEAERES